MTKSVCLLVHNKSASQADYSLDLSLGSSGSTRATVDQMDEESSTGMDQRVPTVFEPGWRTAGSRNTRTKVYAEISRLMQFNLGNTGRA